MAAIGAIRKRSWLLVVVIVVAMLAFILGDMFKSGGGNIEESVISNIDGEGITNTEYEQKVNAQYAKFARMYQNYYKTQVPSELLGQLQEGYLSQYLSEQLYQKQFDAIGLTVSKDEFNDILQGEHVDPALYEQNRLFVNTNGQFVPDSMTKQLAMNSQNPEFMFFLENMVGEQAEKDRLVSKYNTLISKGLYTTSYEAQKQFLAQNERVSFDFIYKSFSSIDDSAVNVTEDDIRDYYNEHKKEEKYKQNDAVSFQYVEFPIIPSQDDKLLAYEALSDTIFINLWKEDKKDSAFVYNHSETKDLNFTFKTSSEFPTEIDAQIQNADTGDIVGPYIEGDYYKLSKVLEVQTQKEATVRHILLGKDKYGDDITVLQKKADSLIRVIRAKNNFEEMVSTFSTDIASVPNGGVYEWFDETRMVPEFTKVSFEKPIGSIATATTTYGVHIIEIQKRRDGKKIKVATVDSRIRPTNETIDYAKDKAIDFLNALDKANIADTIFVNTAKKSLLFVRPADNITVSQKSLAGIDENFVLLQKWAFNKTTNKGDVSDELVLGDKVIVAQLKNRSVEGVPTFENVKDIMKFEVVKNKKAELYLAKMKGKSLQDAGNEIGTSLQEATDVTFTQINVTGAGNEPAIVGKAYALALNEVSKPTKGKSGVYMLQLKTKQEATLPQEYTAQQKQQTQALRGRVQSEVFQALYKAADVKDNRDRVSIIGQ
jgi:peptidyl-prolyl cis-trans isomerase D